MLLRCLEFCKNDGRLAVQPTIMMWRGRGGMDSATCLWRPFERCYSTSPSSPYYLTVGPLNFTSYAGTSLRFQRWLNTDYLPFVSTNMQISTDGTTWTELFSNGNGGEVTANS